MDNDFYQKKTEMFKALANPVRLRIIDLLISGEKCVFEIAEELKCEQPHISKSLAKLKSTELISDRRDGLNIYYKLACPCMGEFLACIDKILKKD